jgi:transposase-like protein
MDSSKVRIRRTVQEKRRIVELTLQPGMSVFRVAQAGGVRSHQVFQWWRAALTIASRNQKNLDTASPKLPGAVQTQVLDAGGYHELLVLCPINTLTK